MSAPNLAAPPAISVVDGVITWQDGSLPANAARPGTYQLRLSQAGYLDTTVTVVCSTDHQGTPAGFCYFPATDPNGFNQANDGTLTMHVYQAPVGSGTVTVSPPPTDLTKIPWDHAVVTVKSKPTASSVSVAVTQTASSATQNLTWTDPNFTTGFAANSTAPTDATKYQLIVTMPGYGSFTTAAFTCARATRCDPGAITLSPQGSFDGSVTAAPAIAAAKDVTLSVTHGADVDNVLASVTDSPVKDDSSANISWTQSPAPTGVVEFSATPYTITASAPGYNTASAQFTCSDSTHCTAPTLALYQNSSLTVEMVDANGDPVNGAVVQISGDTAQNTVTAGAGSNQLTFPNLKPSATGASYNLDIRAAGYAVFSSKTAPNTAISCALTDPPSGATGLKVLAGGTTYCAITLTKLGTFSGHIYGQTTLADGTKSQIPVQAVLVAKMGSTQFPAPADGNGKFTLTGDTTTAGLADGTWTLTATYAGYALPTSTFTVAGSQITASTGSITMDGQDATVVMNVSAIRFQVEMQLNGVDTLPDSSITMVGTNGSYSCTLKSAACATADAGKVFTDTKSKYVYFNVNPGSYVVTVTSSSNSFRQYIVQYILQAGVTPVTLLVNLSASYSDQTGSITDAAGNALPGAIVSLRPQNSLQVIAQDATGSKKLCTKAAGTDDKSGTTLDGDCQKITATAAGDFKFTTVPDGTYQLVATYPGYAPAVRSGITFNSGDPNNNTKLQALQLTTQATNKVVVSVHSKASTTAAPTAGLETATLHLKSTRNIQGLGQFGPVDPSLAKDSTVTDGASTTIAALPTGPWTVGLTSSLRPFGVSPSPASFTEPEPEVGVTPNPDDVDITLTETLTTISYQWTSDTTCSTAPYTGTMIATVKNSDGDSADITLNITTADGVSTARGAIYLPPDTYSWTPKTAPDSAIWQTPTAGGVKVDTNSGATLDPDPVTIAPKQVPVAVAVATRGTDGTTDETIGVGLTVTDAATKNTAAVTDNGADGTYANVCVTAAESTAGSAGLVVKGDTSLPVLMDQQSVSITAGKATINLYALQVTVERPVVGSSATAGLKVDVVVTNDYTGTDNLNKTTVTVPLNTQDATQSSPVYFLVDNKSNVSVSATPEGTTPYSAGTYGPAAITADQTPTVALKYSQSAVTATVVGTDAAATPIAGATVSIFTTKDYQDAIKNKTTPVPMTGHGPFTTGTGGVTGTDGMAQFYELGADAYTLVATYTSGGKTFTGASAVTLKNGTPGTVTITPTAPAGP